MDLSLLRIWLHICVFMSRARRILLNLICLFAPEITLYIVQNLNKHKYNATVKEDSDINDHITLFFYLYPHNCNELAKYIKFIYKYHPFYSWRSYDITITVTRDNANLLVFNPISKTDMTTNQILTFGLIEFDDKNNEN